MIKVFGSLMGPEEIAEVTACLQDQWIGIGPRTARFEENFSKRLSLPGFTLLDSGSNALHMAVKLLDLPPGSEVIVPAFTWIACAHAVVLAGCKPVFCDVDEATGNLTAETVERAMTPEVKAVMAVHYAGLPVAVEELARFDLPIIEDAAHAVDSKRRGVSCGGLGEVGVFSFDAVKNLAMGEGGGLTARDPERLKRSRQLRYCGIGKSGFEASANKARWWEYEIADFFPKMLPSDLAASVGLAQLSKLERMQAYRRRLWDFYQEEFAAVPWLARPAEAPAGDRHSYFTYCVRVEGGRRDALAKHLYDSGVYTTVRYHPLHLNPIYGSKARLPVCEKLNDTALNLPLHPGLSELDAQKVVEAVKAFKA